MWTSSKKNVLTLSKVQIKHFNLFLSGHELPQVFQWLFFTPFDYIISDHPEHDVSLACKVLAEYTVYMKQHISTNILKVYQFSDSCAVQQKNCKHFHNLCFYLHNFDIYCEWNFFTTSHGKLVHDEVSGTVKQIITKTTLQQAIQYQILTTCYKQQLCKEIKGITFMTVCSYHVRCMLQSESTLYSCLNVKELLA